MAGHQSGTYVQPIAALFAAGTTIGLADAELLDRFEGGEGESARVAFEALVERHGPMVFRVCRGVLRDAHDSEDAFQATFLVLARKARSIRRRDSLSAWLHGVAYHVATSARSTADRRRSHERKAGESRPKSGGGGDWDDLGAVVHEELDRLPDRYRTAVSLCYLEGLTQHEAAERMGWPLGTLQSRLARGRERLRVRLTRRGLAPSVALAASSFAIDGAQAAVPAALASSTARLAMSRPLAVGAFPAAVKILAEGVVRSMLLTQLKTVGLALGVTAGLIATGAVAWTQQNAPPKPVAMPAGAVVQPKAPADDPARDGLLTITGTVLLPDGSPASGATVASITEPGDPPNSTRTDATGRFQLRDMLGNGGHLHARTVDGTDQAIWQIPSFAARSALAAPLVIKLSPAIAHVVTVESAGRPVAGAEVVAKGFEFKVHGVTGQDGRVHLRLPAQGQLDEVVAWHPVLGVIGVQDLKARPATTSTQLTLIPPGPHEIRVVDVDGKPVAGLDLSVNIHPEGSDWIVTKEVKAAHVRTNAAGTAIVPWAPRGKLQYVEVEVVGSPWKVDEADLKQLAAGITTVHVRPERAVEGRLVMPEGANPEGILITGFGFGPKNRGDIPRARARRDGTFTMLVPSDHGYVLGVSDLNWASDPWTGLILANDAAQAAEITINAYPATPLTVRVTRGPRHEPVADAFVEIGSSMKNFSWTDSTGEKRRGGGGIRSWARTDSEGVARAGLGRGEPHVRLALSTWDEERTIKVDSDKPIEVEFYRPWVGQRRVTGRLTAGSARYEPSPNLAAHAWTPQQNTLPIAVEPVVHPDGTFEVVFDAESLSIFVADREKRRAGSAQIGLNDATVDLAMEEMATYGGTLLDDNDQPLADRTLRLSVKSSDFDATAAQQTDRLGRFRFAAVPATVPLQLSVVNSGEEAEYFLFDRDRLFNPGEVRENDRVFPRRVQSSTTQAQPSIPLAKKVEATCRNARPSGMLTLVALHGDESRDVLAVTDRLLDYDQTRSVLHYLTIRLRPAQLQAEAATLADLGWPIPAPGQVVLIALDGERRPIATQRLAVADVAASVRLGEEFLKRSLPPTRDALAALAKARKEAAGSGRRVWVILGGPRCGPCFRLARWIEERHATLAKDFVVVKVMEGLDDHADEVVAGLPVKPGEGIPWFAITEPDGKILATSVGPLGNVGFPSSVEDIRHLRRMLDRTARTLTADELDGLVRSISPK